MLRSAELPDLFFCDEGGKIERLSLGQSAGLTNALAEALRETFRPGETVGVAFRTSPELALWWLASLVAGLRPLILQYPTGKQARTYWESSVRNTIALAGLGGIICDDGVRQRLSSMDIRTIARPLDSFNASGGEFTIEAYSIVQLSSGTTGHRKAIEFSSADLARHAHDYNAVLSLSASDMIVSWLPLYHDMGFIACFVMPLLLSVRVTMIDAETWVRNRALLFQAIQVQSGTVCYMPNFGFEVMSSVPAGDLSSMRLWVSCSEPVVARTSRRFIEATQTPEDRFAPCYAMAENIFALTQASGIKTSVIEGVETVSCGRPIPFVDIKIIDGELWVRSPTSLKAYLGGEPIVDSDGFYPTGDLGVLLDGEVYITGRKRDLLVQAGKKFMLSDIDGATNDLLPEVRGRVATVSQFDERLGTHKPIILAEALDFFRRTDQPQVASQVLAETGLDHVEVNFVPPRFLTKTSSGKINRVVSLAHWEALREREFASGTSDFRTELRRDFRHVPFDAPVEDVMDSLSTTVLKIILGDAGVAYDGSKTLAQYLDAQGPKDAPTNSAEVVRIVSLADGRVLRNFQQRHLDNLARALRAPVVFEHVCLPPSPIVLSDLVHYDYFRSRGGNNEDYAAVGRAFEKLRNASVIIMDDAAELHFPLGQTYPVLSHRMERSPDADLLTFRWQRYVEFHHRLPVAVVAGSDLPLRGRSDTIRALSEYVGAPIFRIANVSSLDPFTEDWEFRPLASQSGAVVEKPIDPRALVVSLVKWIHKRGEPLRRVPGETGNRLDMTDLAHFCSNVVDRSKLDLVLGKFDSFCIAGRPSSVSYIGRRLSELGKRFSYVPSYAPQILANTEPFGCLLVCGPMGRFSIEVPAVAVMGWGPGPLVAAGAAGPRRTQNIEDEALRDINLNVRVASCPAEEWYQLTPASGAGTATEVRPVRRVAREARLRSEERVFRKRNVAGSRARQGVSLAHGRSGAVQPASEHQLTPVEPFSVPPRMGSDGAGRGKPIYLFAHIPKTGGTTLRAHFSVHIKPKRDIIWADRNVNLEEHIAAMSAEQRTATKLVMGHFVTSRTAGLFPGREARLLTVLREPVAHVISTYNWYVHMCKTEGGGAPGSFSVWLESKTNLVARRLLRNFGRGAPRQLSGYNPDRLLEEARAILGSFWLVGRLEALEQTLAPAFQALGVPSSIDPSTSRNVTGVDVVRAVERTPEIEALVRDRVTVDMQLYEEFGGIS